MAKWPKERTGTESIGWRSGQERYTINSWSSSIAEIASHCGIEIQAVETEVD